MKSPAEWLHHYQERARALYFIPWEHAEELTPAERKAVAASVPEFQLGESSEGHHLMHDAAVYGARAGDEFYPQTIRYFIWEEQRHALVLGRFLELHGIPLATTTWADRAFRRARNLCPGLELSIAVLVTGELIAQVYYRVLRDATGSFLLRTLCGQILRDEVTHVAFQTEQLARLHAARGPMLHALSMGWQRLMFFAAVLVVGISHRGVIQCAGMSPMTWWRACWRRFEAAFSSRLRAEARGAFLAAKSTSATRTAFSPEALA